MSHPLCVVVGIRVLFSEEKILLVLASSNEPMPYMQSEFHHVWYLTYLPIHHFLGFHLSSFSKSGKGFDPY
jgi:hypothetical protein